MSFRSLKDFVDFLEERGELKRIKTKVSPKLEITEIADRLVKKGDSPALLFENVEGSKFPVLINALASEKRMAWALGCEKLDDLADELAALIKTQPPQGLRDKIKMIPKLKQIASFMPKRVASGDCQDVVLRDKDVDLSQLPILTCWPKDAGPFITFPLVITQDPDTKIRNIGIYRMQVLDKTSTAMHWQIHKTGRRHFEQYRERGEKMPVAVAIGGDPSLTWAACAPLPDGVDECLMAGFARKKGVELVKCKTNDLYVPADADFILEGFVDPKEDFVIEGPFGDHTGYYTPPESFPRFHVTTITHRKNPIYFTTIVGRPPMEDAWMGKAVERIFLPLLKMTFPEVVDMHVPAVACFHNLAIISLHKQYPGHGKKMMMSLWGMGQMMTNKCLIIVDHDVDVHNLYEVVWRVTNNIDAKRDISFVEGPVDHLDHASPHQFIGSKMGIDATRKLPEEEYYRRWPDDVEMDAATKTRIDALWKDL
ncbi:MAG: menaquinone biosynthesis decarboxylase [Deltaproteobacteria bacterium]|nr:menaquinone biosynthesis decarboxylase [Deltaproteobacteria bacterium]